MQNLAGEEPADEDLAVPEPGFASVNQCGYARDQCPQNIGNPAHRGAVGRFVDLIGNGLVRCHQLATQQVLGQPIHQQTEHHHEAQGNHPLWLLDKHRGSQKKGIFEKTKPTLHASLLFIGRDHLFMRKALRVEDVGCHDEGRFLSGQNRHLLLIHLKLGTKYQTI